MKVLEFNEDDYRDLDLSEEEMIQYEVDEARVETLRKFLGYELRTDGESVYAVADGDVIEIGKLQKQRPAGYRIAFHTTQMEKVRRDHTAGRRVSLPP